MQLNKRPCKRFVAGLIPAVRDPLLMRKRGIGNSGTSRVSQTAIMIASNTGQCTQQEVVVANIAGTIIAGCTY